MFKLYLIEDYESFSHDDYYRFLNLIPPERQQRIQRYRRNEDKQASAVSWLLMRLMLKQQFDIETVDIAYNEYGKPYLLGQKNVYFNISHCRTGCLCGISDVPVGVDIQNIKAITPGTPRYVCCDEELQNLGCSPDPNRTFAEMWAIKESILKMRGIGIGGGLKSVNSLKYRDRILVMRRNDTVITAACSDRLGEMERCTV